MKKHFLIGLFLVILISNDLFGQKSRIKFQIGYAFPIISGQLTTNYIVQSSSSVNLSGVYGSFGSGLQLESGYEYCFSQIISGQLDVLYSLGNEVNSFTSNPINNGTTFSRSESISARFFEISPLIKFHFSSSKRIIPYVALGPNIATGTINSKSIIQTSDELHRVYTGPISIGSKAALGLRLTNGRIGFYGQLTVIGLSFAPSRSEVVKYFSAGMDQLSYLPVRAKQTIYVESTTTTSNPDNLKPREELRVYFPLSSISFNIGFTIKL